MRAPRRFPLAYPRPSVSASIRRAAAGTWRTKSKHPAARAKLSNQGQHEEQLSFLLDEEFDEFACEPRLLLQLANQT